MANLFYFHASAATTFNLSLTILSLPGSSAGPSQSTVASGLRPGLWRITYTNGFPAGYGGGAAGVAEIQALGSYYDLNPASGFIEWHNRGIGGAGYVSDGTINPIKPPATNTGTLQYESYFCSGLPFQITLQTPYTSWYDGLTIAADGVWQTSCG